MALDCMTLRKFQYIILGGISHAADTNRCLSGNLWYLQHSCVGDTNNLPPRQRNVLRLLHPSSYTCAVCRAHFVTTLSVDDLAPSGDKPSATTMTTSKLDMDGLVQDWSYSSALAMELLQSCTKPSICFLSLWLEQMVSNKMAHKIIRNIIAF